MPFAPRSILCPIDFSDHARAALQCAVAWAARFEATLAILSVNEPSLVKAALATYGPDYLANKSAEMIREFHAASVLAGAAWVPAPQVLVREGDPAEQILAVARDIDADLVVMGTLGLGGYRKLVFGSTTEDVLHQTSVPIMAVPISERSPVSLETEGPVFDLERILVPVGFDAATRADVQVAVDLGRRLGAPLLLLHVVTPAHADPHWSAALEAEDRIRVAEARDRLAELAGDAQTGDGVATHVAVGRVSDEIAAVAAERQARLIVMGLRGSQGWLGPRAGTIAYRVLCLASAPVLLVPSASEST